MIKRLIPKSEFSKNVLTLMTGTTIAQAIPIAITPILTRIYTPEDFGLLALFVSITAVLGAIANGRYELAIMLPEKDEDAINIAALGLLIAICFSVVIFLLVFFLNAEIVNVLNSPDISLWLYFIPFVVFMTGFFNILNYLNIRKKLYKDIAKANVFKSIGMASVQLGIGFIKAGVTGLISGQIVAQLISIYRLSLNTIKNYRMNTSKFEILRLLKRYKKFPLYSVPSAFVNTGSLQAPVIMLSYFFSQSITGFFSLAVRVISLPVSLIGASIGHVFFQQVSQMVSEGRDTAVYVKNTLIKLTVIGILPFSVLIVYADILFPFVFGGEWIRAGDYAQYLSIWLFFLFIHSPLTPIFEIYERQKAGLVFTTLLLFARIAVMLLFYFLYENDLYVISAYAVVGVIFNIAILWYMLRVIGLRPTFLILKIVSAFCFSVFAMFVLKQVLFL